MSSEVSAICEPPGLSPGQLYPQGVELFSQGCALDEVLHLDSGWVKLSRVNQDGREIILELAFAGAWLGTAAVLARTQSPVSVVTCTPARVARMPAGAFREMMQRDSALSRHIHQVHACELCRQIGWIGQLNSLTSRERLQRVIRQFIAVLNLPSSADDVRLNLPLRHRELAQLIVVTPEHLSRLLKELQGEGVIKRQKGWVIIPNVKRLCADCDCDYAPWCDTSRAAADVDLHQDCG